MFGLAEVERLAVAAGLAIGRCGGQRQSIRQMVSGQRRQTAEMTAIRRVVDPTHSLDRRPTFAGTLGVDDVPADVIERHRVGGEEQAIVPPGAPRLVPAARPALVDADQAVEDVQRRLLPQTAACDTACGMKVLHWLGPEWCDESGQSRAPCRPRWLRATLLFMPCDMFFRASVTPAERWSLRTGMVMILLTIRDTIIDRCER